MNQFCVPGFTRKCMTGKDVFHIVKYVFPCGILSSLCSLFQLVYLLVALNEIDLLWISMGPSQHRPTSVKVSYIKFFKSLSNSAAPDSRSQRDVASP